MVAADRGRGLVAQAVTALASGGRCYRVERRLVGGRQGGAWLASDEAGAPVVIKITLDAGLLARRDETAALVAALGDRGYPTPR